MAKRASSGKGRAWWWVAAIVLAGAAIAFAIGWWRAGRWAPEEAAFPDQGALVSDQAGGVNFATLKAVGAGFAYLEASRGADARDINFPANLEQATAANLLVGVVHLFDPCVPADRQSANFVTLVPRDIALLPTAIALDHTANECPERVNEAEVESELMTLINQIEIHTGTPVILKPSKEFEQTYGIAARIERNLWLTQNWVEPTYAGRPWLLWTANDAMQTEAGTQPLAWVVVRP